MQSQDASLVFLSDEDVDVAIYRPMDGFYNFFYCNDTISLKSGTEYIYKVNVKDWGVVKCIFSDHNKFEIYVESNDSLHIIKENKVYRFEGKNAFDNQCYNNELLFSRISSIRDQIDDIFNKNIDDESINTKLIRESLDTDIWTKLYAIIDSVYSNNTLKGKGYDFFKTNTTYTVSNNILETYVKLLLSRKSFMKDPINMEIEALIKRVSPYDESIFKYPDGITYAELYYSYLYDTLSIADKNNLILSRDAREFGPYKRYILIPADKLIAPLFSAFIVQYQFGINEFNRVKMYDFLARNFPHSESVQVIQNYVNEELNDTTKTKAIFIETESVDKLSDIAKIEGLKGKFIFIDLWATWCMPCRQEFLHNKQLYRLLSEYGNAEILYISIDENKKRWEKDLESLKLSGYHLLASQRLLDELRKEIYGSRNITIPRYILLDKDGKILNDDLPRPSQSDELKKALESILKK